MGYIGKSPTPVPLSVSDLDDDIVSLAKMASGTDGNLITYDTSGNPAAVATGNDGQVLTSAGAGNPCLFEAASSGGLVGYAYSNNGAETTINSTSMVSTGLSVAYTPTDYSNNKIIVMCHGPYVQDGANGEYGYYQIKCTGQHATDFNEVHSSIDSVDGAAGFHISFLMRDTALVNNSGAETYTLWMRSTQGGAAQSDMRPNEYLTMSVMEIGV